MLAVRAVLRLCRVLAVQVVRPGRFVLARQSVPARHQMLAGRPMRSMRVLGPWPVRSGAGAVPHPYGTRSQQAPEFTRAWQVGAIPGAQREVLGLARQIAARMPPGAGTPAGRGGGRRTGEPVVGIGPGGNLVRVEPRLAHPVGQLGKLMTAALANGRERNRVPCQRQGDLIRTPRAVTACNWRYRQHGPIDAT